MSMLWIEDVRSPTGRKEQQYCIKNTSYPTIDQSYAHAVIVASELVPLRGAASNLIDTFADAVPASH
ncbi:hypothetical protein BV898_18317, partial [Hypsibius exemplaris]